MQPWRVVTLAIYACTAVAVAGWAQPPEGAEPRQLMDVPVKDQPVEPGRKGLPAWLKLGVELRGRAESGEAFDSDSREQSYLNRLRINTTVQPTPWMRFFLQGQDARAVSLDAGRDSDDLQDTFDIRQAYADFGHSEQGLQLRVGRQELALGDERLVGADSYWDSFGQAFDAVSVSFAEARLHAVAFIGFRVQPARRRLDPFDTASRISGLSAQFKLRDELVLEPYLLWKRGEDTVDLMERPGHRDVLTPGVRSQGNLPRNLDYNVEMALQRGHLVRDGISAWAGHWEVGWKPLGKDSGLRVGMEYNFASGDKDPCDGKHQTFDDLYPAGFNKYGMEDPIAWRNIRYPAIGAELPITRHWTLYGGYRQYWLASIHDGLYPGGDEYLVRNPAARSTDVGSQALISAGYVRPERWRLYAGYGHFFAGTFLREAGYQKASETAYLLFSVSY